MRVHLRHLVPLRNSSTAIGVVLAYMLYGWAVNIYVFSSHPSETLIYILIYILMLFWYGLMLFSIFALDFKIEEWGFTLEKKASISIALGLVVLLIVYFKSKVVIPTKLSWDFILSIFGSSAEELCFRVLAIIALLVIFQNSKYKGWWAVLGSSILFTIPHLHGGKPLDFVITGIFPSSLILGFIYYKTRSNFLPIMTHVLSNTAGEGGILAGLIFTFIYFLLVIGKKILIKVKTDKDLFLDSP